MRWNILFLLLLCLAASGCGLIRIETLYTPTPEITETPIPPTQTPIPTETIVWFPPTSTPKPLMKPTPYKTINMMPLLGETLFSDDFSSSENWQTFRSPNGNAVISNNEFTFAISEGEGDPVSYASIPHYDRFFLQTDINLSICSYYRDTYSIYFRVQDSENYYRWVFNCQGETRVERLYKGKLTILQDWEPNGAVRKSAPQKFTVGIESSGTHFRFFGNNGLLFECEDVYDYLPSGGFGFGALSAGRSPLSVSFSRFLIQSILPENE